MIIRLQKISQITEDII